MEIRSTRGVKSLSTCDGGIAQPLVILEVAADKSQLRAKLACTPARHAAAHAKCLRFVRSGKHNTAADRDGLAAQRRVKQLLDRGVEGNPGQHGGWWLRLPSKPFTCAISRGQSGSGSSENAENIIRTMHLVKHALNTPLNGAACDAGHPDGEGGAKQQ